MRVKALETILVRKGLVDPAAVDAIIDQYEHHIGILGLAAIARAWHDPEFKSQLVNNTDGILADMGFGGRQGEHIVVVENTPDCHNLVVCTLCSCYPWPVLEFLLHGINLTLIAVGPLVNQSSAGGIWRKYSAKTENSRLGLNR